jgi:hypothetical protein
MYFVDSPLANPRCPIDPMSLVSGVVDDRSDRVIYPMDRFDAVNS